MKPAYLLQQSLLSSYAATTLDTNQGGCHDLTIPVEVHKTTAHEFAPGQPYTADVLFALATKQILVSNSYNISARLCLPPAAADGDSGNSENHRSAAETLQVLVHGATFNKNMWDVGYKPEVYSWVRRMGREGYATLAVDLVGAGNSTFPDGLLETQTQTYVEVMHQVLTKIRAGDAVFGGRTWRKIVFVGFSIGGITANSLSAQYPADADALVLHGISWEASWIYPAFLAGLQAPAQQVDPDKWGHLAPFYQTQSTREGRLVACFASSYEPEMVEWDWQTRDFDTLGAAITFTYHLVAAPEFKGPVFLGIGREDNTFCGGQFCRQQPYGVYESYPGASAWDVKVYEDTGHVILYHDSAKDLMADTLSFLRNNGF